jgi:hypothetical protein
VYPQILVPPIFSSSRRKTTIRGALTNGRGWIFLILTLNDKDGGTYLQSPEILAYNVQNFTEELSKDAASLLSLIVAHWVCLTACCPEAADPPLPGLDDA